MAQVSRDVATWVRIPSVSLRALGFSHSTNGAHLSGLALVRLSSFAFQLIAGLQICRDACDVTRMRVARRPNFLPSGRVSILQERREADCLYLGGELFLPAEKGEAGCLYLGGEPFLPARMRRCGSCRIRTLDDQWERKMPRKIHSRCERRTPRRRSGQFHFS